MNKFLLLFFSLILLLSPPIVAQIDSTSLSKDQKEVLQNFNEFLTAVEKRDHEKVVSLTYPELFEATPLTKEQFMQAMEKMYGDSSITMILGGAKIQSISEIMEIENAQYAIMDYTSNMTMIFHEQFEEEENEDGEEESFLDFNPITWTLEMLKEKFGEENVSYEEEEQKINVQMNEGKSIAVKKPDYTHWTFMENKQSMMKLQSEILPKEIIEAARPEPKPCDECSSLQDALADPERVTSLVMNPHVNSENLDSVPPTIGKLVNVEELFLTDHSFTSIPKEIGQLQKVTELSFVGCQLEELPDEIFTLSNLEEVLLYDNQFSKKYTRKLRKRFKKAIPDAKVYLYEDEYDIF